MMRNLKKYFTGALILLVLLTACFYSENAAAASKQIIPFDSGRWEIIDAPESRVEDYLGEKSLFLKGVNCLAIVKDSQFTDGIIEYDIAFSQGRGFAGAVWRKQSDNDHEEWYMRIHQSGNPDAMQYTPKFNGLLNWQLYSGEGFITAYKYPFDQWLHVKIIVSGQQAEVYIQDMDKPVLFIPELKQEIKAGQVGLMALNQNNIPIHFANFSYVSMSNPPLKGKAKQIQPTPPGTIMTWLVSNAFDEKSLEGKLYLTEKDKQNFTWKKLNTERSGLANIGKLQGIVGDKNTAFARVTINSDNEQIKPIQIGFSDRVRLYFNNQLMYGGHDEFTSRDYKFLGIIGYYDEVYLPVKKGKNELWMAISDTTDPTGGGGWGLQAKFEDSSGISVTE